ncbi:MAG: thioredoxin family protein [Thermoanaerobaculia bacterium]
MSHLRFEPLPPSQAGKSLAVTFSLLALVVVVVLQACGPKSPKSAETQESEGSHEAITWFEGDVADAFELAEAQGKPVFLYWGAEWCPPCHYLKDKLFTRPEFIDRMADFVPVYLDGDTERAQIWGERLAVKGYPTVIVFNAAGEEVMRMPSTLPVDQYQEVLDSAMDSTRPVQAVLDDVMARGPASADATDLAILAFYSWSQDSSVGLEAAERMSTFRRLYDESPVQLEVERSRFLTQYLVSAAEVRRETSGADEAGRIPDDELATLNLEAVRILSNEALRSANLGWVLYYSTDTVELLAPDPGQRQSDLITAWQTAAVEIENDTTLPINDRLNALMPQIALARFAAEPESAEEDGDSWVASEALEQHVRERVSWAADEVSEEGELQTTMNTMAYLLSSVGLEGEAETLLAARMNDTVAPYYFMSWMGSIKEDAGKTEEALAWYRKAYESSTGRYSRFRWGSMYLRNLLELAPEDTQTIENHSKEVLAELLTLEDAFSGGNHSRLQGLERSYWDWNASGDHAATIGSLRDFVLSTCDGFPSDGEDSQRDRCSSFLAEEGAMRTDPV